MCRNKKNIDICKFFEDPRPIGFFDSGFGGMTVLKEFVKAFPEEDFVYVADSANFPYGQKTKKQIISYSLKICKFLEKSGVKLIVVSCGTATSAALDILQKSFTIPIIGVIEAAANVAIETTKNKKIGVIATQATIDLGLFKKYITNADSKIEVTNISAPELVNIAESNCSFFDNLSEKDIDIETCLSTELDIATKENIDIAKRICRPFIENNIDTLILGCTHFPLLISIFGNIFNENICFINPGSALVQEILDMNKQIKCSEDLYNNCLEHIKFYTTGNDIQKFKNVTKYIFQKNLNNFYKICV